MRLFVFRASKNLTSKDLTRLLNEDPVFMKELDAIRSDCDDDDDSDEETEVITYNEHDSESEQEYESDSEEIVDRSHSMKNYYIGKDNQCKWSKSVIKKTSKVGSKNIIKTFPGPKGSARGVTSEIAAFSKIISIEMMDNIVKCTNSYIELKKESVMYKRDRDAKVTSRSEVMALLGLLYLLGVKKTNHTNVKELWSNDGSGIEMTRAVMSYNRFLFLLRCIRFDEKSTRQERRVHDKLAAIRAILDEFVTNCKSTYNLSEFVTIDEKLQAFRGRCGFVQYIPNKPAKYGIKMFALCDAKTFFTGNLEVYCGQQPEGPYAVSNSPSEIVHRLVNHIEGSKRNITMDNWYTSYPLAVSLLTEKKLTCIGTLRKNKREIPPEFLPQKNRAPNSTLFGYQQDMTLVSYVPKKNKAVLLISTLHDSGTIDEHSQKPDIVLEYNSTKIGVDTVDQMCATYSVARITRRWPLVIFFALLDIAGINAQVLFHSKFENPKLLRRFFLKNLAYDMMKPHLMERAKIPSLPSDISIFLRRYRETSVVVEEPSAKKRGRCVVCGRAKNNNTTIKCDSCQCFVCKKHVKITYVCDRCQNIASGESDN